MIDPSPLPVSIHDTVSQALASAAARLPASCGPQAPANLTRIARRIGSRDLVESLVDQLAAHLPAISDPPMALNQLERFFEAARSPLALAALLERDPAAVPILLRIFSTSQYLSDLLVRDTEAYDALRLTEGQPLARQLLIDELTAEIETTDDAEVARAMIRRFKHREILRVAYGDIIGGQDIETVTRQISHVADAACQAAWQFAHRQLAARWGQPRGPDGTPSRFVILAMGKLGGSELNYSSDIDLVMFYDEDGRTDGRSPRSAREFFEELARQTIRLLTDNTDLGIAYRVDMRLRPEGAAGPLVMSVPQALAYYDRKGRTWERQALIKARPVAGDLALGHRLLADLRPWIYPRHLTAADIAGIQSLKRRMERQLRDDQRDVKSGLGGIRDIEFVTQFLQLLHGGDQPSLQSPNTLHALRNLHAVDSLTSQEHAILDANYRWLRKLEHRLQIMFDLQTHELPDDPRERHKLALRMGYEDTAERTALESFSRDLRRVRRLNRRILDHLLNSAFEGTGAAAAVEVDLVLDPAPEPSFVATVLTPYGFRDVESAYRHLSMLAQERNVFLSPRRARHFLAAIAPRLLAEIAKTPNPDATLRALAVVSDSLGGKAVLWELLSSHAPSLQLFVRLCATSPYLCDILTNSPGMIDGLIDSLLVEHLPSYEFLKSALDDLIRNAEDINPILHSFKNAQHLRVGVRDILSRDSVRDTHRALSDVAEVCLRAVADRQRQVALAAARAAGSDEADSFGPLVMVAMGKLGGREPNYHSDLDVVFLWESAGPAEQNDELDLRRNHFFNRLAAAIIKGVSTPGPFGQLYQLDSRLRPTGKSGSLAVSFDQFRRYFGVGPGATSSGQFWERMALCQARPLVDDPQLARRTSQLIVDAILAEPWTPRRANEVFAMRIKLEENSNPSNIKRGAGGTMDIEFAVQMLQLRHAATRRDILVPGTLAAAERLRDAGLIDRDDFRHFSQSYIALRHIEARLRLINTTARHDLPQNPDQLETLAYLLGHDSPAELVREVDALRRENRRRFQRLVERCSQD
jgi:glutamate-ammonia-ligase adenylyltransferase